MDPSSSQVKPEDAFTRSLYKRQDWTVLIDLVDRLCEATIEQFAHYTETCTVCGERAIGILDEGLLTLPVPGISSVDGEKAKHNLLKALGSYPARFSSRQLTGPLEGFRFMRSAYEARMEIVRSGIWTRKQLQGALFNQHELEVNDVSFRALRPRRCDCDFGEPTESDWVGFSAPFGGEVPPETEVERAFVSSRPVRTGFRLRSKAASLRRSRSRSRVRVIEVVSSATKGPILFEDIPIKLKVKFFPWKNGRKTKKPRNPRPDGIGFKIPFDDPFVGHSVYSYFRRKRGTFYVSRHHPYGDESKIYASRYAYYPPNKGFY